MNTRSVVELCLRSPRFWAMAGTTMALSVLGELQSFLTLFLTGQYVL